MATRFFTNTAENTLLNKELEKQYPSPLDPPAKAKSGLDHSLPLARLQELQKYFLPK